MKLFKDLQEFKTNRNRFFEYKRDELEFIEYTSSKKEFDEYKAVIAEYKKNKNDFEQYIVLKNKFDSFLQIENDFDTYIKTKDEYESYKKVMGDGSYPHFMMYASEVDKEGNVTFSYDFNPDFVDNLKKQGIQGIDDIEVIESYLHMVFSQNYFFGILGKDDETSKE